MWDSPSNPNKSKEEADSALRSEAVEKGQQLMLGELRQKIEI